MSEVRLSPADEIEMLKSALELDIKSLIERFRKKTGLRFIAVKAHYASNDPYGIRVDITLRLESTVALSSADPTGPPSSR